MSVLQEFFDQNRRTGSTTNIVFIAALSGGYLVVGNSFVKRGILAQFPGFDDKCIITLNEIRDGKFRGRQSRPVFIDVTALTMLTAEDLNWEK